MTVSRPLSSLSIFQSKVEEALNLVPAMCAEDKLKAVHFWNVVSEKLQDIVNSSAADINAVALTMEEVESAKMNLGINTETDTLVTESTVSNSEFTNLSTIYAISSDTSVQYHASISNNQLKPFTTNSLLFSNCNKQSPFNEVTTFSHNHQLLPGHSDLSDSSVHTDQSTVIENIPVNSCDNSNKDNQSMNDAPFTEIKRDCNRNNDAFPSPKKNLFHCRSSLEEKSEVIESNVNPYSVIIESKNLINSERINVHRESSSQSNKDSDSRTSSVNSDDATKEQIVLRTQNVEETSEPSLESIPEMEASHSKEIFSKDEDKTIRDTFKNTNDDLVCKVCSKSFSDEDSLTRHHLRAHERHYSCSECKAKFSTKSNLLVHMRRHTGEKPFCCHKCSAHFTTNGNLQRHIRTHSGAKPWQCNRCGTCFTEKKSLTIHMRRHTGERPYQCKECGKSFSQTSILQTHMSMHSETKMHLCEVCGKSFRQKSQLRVHRLRHDNIRPFGCSICPLAYITRGDLLRHEKTHTTEKPYKCDVCPKGFTRQQSLNEHKNRHYGIKPYKCKHCGKAFPEMSGCYKHMKVHEKAKELEDSIKEQEHEPEPEITEHIQVNSGVSTVQDIAERDLLRHEKSHTTEKPYKCDVCPKVFTRQQSLNEHKNRHYGIKPYKCKHCGEAFSEMSGCYKHMKVHEKAKELEDSIKEQEHETEPEITEHIQINSGVSTVQDIAENKVSNVTDSPAYIAVVLNSKHPNELGDEINQAVSFLNSGLEDNNMVQNGIGVLTAINILTNATTFPQNFQNIS